MTRSTAPRGAIPWLKPLAIAVAVLVPAVCLDARTVGLAAASLRLIAVAAVIALPIGITLGFLWQRCALPGHRALGTLLIATLFLPLYVQAAGWLAGFGLQGWFTEFTGNPPWLGGWQGAAWIHAMAAVPWIALITATGLRLVEPELEDDARLATSLLTVLSRVTLRRAAAAVAVAGAWLAVTVAGEMTVTDLLQVRTFAEELYTQAALGAEPSEAAFGVVPLVAITAWLALAAAWAGAKLAPMVRDRQPHGTTRFALGNGAWLGTLATALLLLLFVGIPLANLFYQTGVTSRPQGDGWVRDWSLAKSLTMLAQSPARYWDEIGWSLALGGAAATASLVIAAPLAWMARTPGTRGVSVLVGSSLLVAIPGPTIGLTLIAVFNRPALALIYDSPWGVPVMALFARALPWTLLVLWHALRSLPSEGLETAALDGAGSWSTLVRVALPQRKSACAAAWLVALAIATGDLSASILVLPAGVTTVAVEVFNLAHYGVEDQLAALCLTLAFGAAAIAAAIARLLREPRG